MLATACNGIAHVRQVPDLWPARRDRSGAVQRIAIGGNVDSIVPHQEGKERLQLHGHPGEIITRYREQVKNTRAAPATDGM